MPMVPQPAGGRPAHASCPMCTPSMLPTQNQPWARQGAAWPRRVREQRAESHVPLCPRRPGLQQREGWPAVSGDLRPPGGRV